MFDKQLEVEAGVLSFIITAPDAADGTELEHFVKEDG
jgi:hypothetical protein